MRFPLRIGVLVAITACGGQSKESRVPGPPTAKVIATEAEPPPDLSPVASPSDLVLVGRVARPRMLVETLAAWGGAPLKLSDVLPVEAREFGAAVAWDAPIEIAAVLDRRSSDKVAAPLGIISIGLTSLERGLELARANGANPTRVAPGVFRITPREDLSCALAAAIGAAPVRLICSDAWRSVEELWPYASRGLPKEDLGSEDLKLELRAAPLKRRYEQEIGAVRLLAGLLLRQIQTDHARLDRAIADVAYGLADELKTLAFDLDRVELRGKLDETGNVLELGSGISFVDQTSFYAESIRESAQRSGPPPELFWTLPRPALAASFTSGSNPNRLAIPVRALIELVDAYLEQQKAGPLLRRHVRGVVEALPALLAASVQASFKPGLPKSASPRDRLSHVVGLHLGVVQERSERISKLLTGLGGALADRDFARLAKERFGLDARQLPKLRSRAVRVAGFAARATAFSLEIPASLLTRLPGSEPKPETKALPPAAPGTVVVVLAPDGERTWLSVAGDEKSATSRLESARAGKEGRLDEIAELAPLKSERLIGGGFWTLEGALGWLQVAVKGRSDDLAGLLSQAPNRGLTPGIVRWRVTDLGKGFRLDSSLSVPRGAFQDLAGLAPWVVGVVGD